MVSAMGAVPGSGSPAPRTALAQGQDAESEQASLSKRPGPWPPRMEPLPPEGSYNPRLHGTWARRSGFKSNMSEEGGSIVSDAEIHVAEPANGGVHKPPTSSDHAALRDSDNGSLLANGAKDKDKPRAAGGVPNASPPVAAGPVPVAKKVAESGAAQNTSGHLRIELAKAPKEHEVDMMSQSQDADDGMLAKHSHMKYELTDTPGIVPLMLYGVQHYFSIAGSLVLIPLVIVPAMGGTDEDVAKVISTMLLVSGITTLLHTWFGSRLPLIQGASFAYLGPALTIINSFALTELPQNKRFRHIMRELQGAVLISSIFQVLVGYSGLMAWLLRVINPVVVAPTVAAVGLAFFTYGFPVLGSCVEIGIPQVVVVVFFALYLRKISVFGHRVFQIYAVPLGLGITWAYAFLLTESGAYDYKGCNMSSVTPECHRHVFTMRHCRTDVSHALKNADWIRFPYPFQWGAPTFSLKTGLVMVAASVIASVDSVGSYHAASLLVASRAPPPGVVSRGIGLEGLTSALAGLWGTGVGATTLTENVHTIAVTKMGSRRAIEFGALVLIGLSFVGKIGAFIASIPQVLVAALLCVMWAMLAALGLSNLRYSETGSSRNVLIVGLSLFLCLSVPAYFQQYNDAHNTTKQSVPIYFQPFTTAFHGPVRTKYHGVNFVLNSVLSFHMVIAFLVAFVLDNTVPGSRQERGMYVWSEPKIARRDPVSRKEYGLPLGLNKFFLWLKWVGL